MPAVVREGPASARHQARPGRPTARPEADAEPLPGPAARRDPGGRRGSARRRPRLLAVLASLLLAGALVAAGVWWFAVRTTTVAPAAYAQAVCGSVRDWQQDLDGRTSALTTSVARQDNPTAIRAAVGDYYTQVAARTDSLRAALIGAGVPNLKGGHGYADGLVSTVTTQVAALRDAAARADRLDVSSPAPFQAAVRSLLTAEGSSVTAVITAIAHPPSGTPAEIRAMLGGEPSCAPFTG